MATIHDVAARAGVSVATVSRYFNGGYVGAPNRVAIEAAVEELGYRPNSVARALSAKSSRVVGLVVPSITNPFFPELAQAVEEECARRDYRLVLCNAGGSIEKERLFIGTLAASFADGIITSTGNCGAAYDKLGVPVVSVDRELGTSAPHITSDNYEGGRMALHCLERSGRRRLLFIGAPDESTSQSQRREGFLSEARLAGLEAEVLTVDEDDEGQALAREAGRLAAYDGIFAWNDIAAIEAVRALVLAGRRVPEDCAIIGFDDVHMGRLFIPSLSTVAQRIYEMGRAATELLMRMIAGERLVGVTYLLGVELIERETTAGKPKGETA
jgi:DNA-binding LacI/PurR family transcriptional regulator